ncbi:hypothetical protein B0J17DRAFT_626075 [Rhizoctonia solani]|nr:hypothetical protein B0J17DRAFT_626075 [Rhizoctonia solani]
MEAKPKTCYKCNETGHISRDCPQNNQGGEASGGGYGGGSNAECYKCGKVGHIARACPEATSGGYGGGGGGGGMGGKSWVPSATTATELGIFPRIAHNLNDGLATPVALKDTSRVTAPTRAAQPPKVMKRGERLKIRLEVDSASDVIVG